MNDLVCTYCGQTGHRASQCPRRPRERDVKAYLLRRVREAKGEVRKVSWEGRVGAPDWLVMRPYNMPVFVELKAPGEQLRPTQRREIDRMRALNVNVEVVDSMDAVDALFA